MLTKILQMLIQKKERGLSKRRASGGGNAIFLLSCAMQKNAGRAEGSF